MSRHLNTPNRSLFIRQIPYNTRAEDLRYKFSKYGYIRDVYIPRDYYSRQIRGFAYVEFEDIRDAEYAVKHPIFIDNMELQVEFAQGDRKTPREMKMKFNDIYRHQKRSFSNDRCSRRHHRSRSRSPSATRRTSRVRHHRHHHRNRSRSRTRSKSTSNHHRCHRSPKPIGTDFSSFYPFDSIVTGDDQSNAY